MMRDRDGYHRDSDKTDQVCQNPCFFMSELDSHIGAIKETDELMGQLSAPMPNDRDHHWPAAPNFSALGTGEAGGGCRAHTAPCVHHQMKLASFCMGDLVQCFPMDQQRPPLIARCGPLVRPYESQVLFLLSFVAIF